MEATKAEPSDQGESHLPDSVSHRHRLRHRRPDDCQPGGDGLRVSYDSFQHSCLLHIYRVEKQTEMVQPYDGWIYAEFTKVNDGGAAKTEISAKSGSHTIPPENAHGRRKDQTSSGLNASRIIIRTVCHHFRFDPDQKTQHKHSKRERV